MLLRRRRPPDGPRRGLVRKEASRDLETSFRTPEEAPNPQSENAHSGLTARSALKKRKVTCSTASRSKGPLPVPPVTRTKASSRVSRSLRPRCSRRRICAHSLPLKLPSGLTKRSRSPVWARRRFSRSVPSGLTRSASCRRSTPSRRPFSTTTRSRATCSKPAEPSTGGVG